MDAILEGIAICKDWLQQSRIFGAESEEEPGMLQGGDMCEPEPIEFDIPFALQDGSLFVDANNGRSLPAEKVALARRGEIEAVSKCQVYEFRPRSEARAEGQRPIGVR